MLRALCDLQGLRTREEEGDHGDAEGERCSGGYYEIISEGWVYHRRRGEESEEVAQTERHCRVGMSVGG